ncbi:hypothetical protein B0H13DRAFT_2128416 [Mycena leptocephala]|nr:hypothetical protein B0H13DRAFT_2128416 [Mycena leptocephala]
MSKPAPNDDSNSATFVSARPESDFPSSWTRNVYQKSEGGDFSDSQGQNVDQTARHHNPRKNTPREPATSPEYQHVFGVGGGRARRRARNRGDHVLFIFAGRKDHLAVCGGVKVGRDATRPAGGRRIAARCRWIIRCELRANVVSACCDGAVVQRDTYAAELRATGGHRALAVGPTPWSIGYGCSRVHARHRDRLFEEQSPNNRANLTQSGDVFSGRRNRSLRPLGKVWVGQRRNIPALSVVPTNRVQIRTS